MTRHLFDDSHIKKNILLYNIINFTNSGIFYLDCFVSLSILV